MILKNDSEGTKSEEVMRAVEASVADADPGTFDRGNAVGRPEIEVKHFALLRKLLKRKLWVIFAVVECVTATGQQLDYNRAVQNGPGIMSDVARISFSTFEAACASANS